MLDQIYIREPKWNFPFQIKSLKNNCIVISWTGNFNYTIFSSFFRQFGISEGDAGNFMYYKF